MENASSKILIAIDPGKSGGIAWEKDGQTFACKTPEAEGDLLNLLAGLKQTDATATVILEDVGGFIGVPQPGSRMFTFGNGFGFIRGVLMALRFRVELVKPQKWQAALSLGSSKRHASSTAWKNHLKTRAQQLYPNLNITLATSDALLLLEYAKSLHSHPR